MPSSVVISCAGDNELAKKISDYMMDKISPSTDTLYILVSEDELELVLEKLGVSKEDIKKLLQDFIKSDPNLLAARYSVTEFDNLFVIGIPKSLDDMAVNCEICGYIASDEEDLNIHKRTHGLIFIV